MLVIREFFGADLSPESIVSVAKDQETLKPRLRERYLEFIHDTPLAAPPKRASEVRPVLDNVLPVIGSPRSAEHVIEAVCFSLLYGHSAAVPDVFAAQLDGTDDYDLAAVVQVYSAVAPLIDRDLLVLVDPTNEVNGPHLFDLLRQLEPLVEQLRTAVDALPP